MTCASCTHEWPLLPAHVIRTAHIVDGIMQELIACPKCGHIQKRIVEEQHAVEK